MGTWIVDLDGTLALRGDRSPYDWGRVGEDLPNEPVIRVVRALVMAGDDIIFVSGRMEQCRAATTLWLERNLCAYPQVCVCARPLFMRPNDDYRPDGVLKKEIYAIHIAGRYEVTGVLDDRSKVVQMWRNELGLTCLAVADGNF